MKKIILLTIIALLSLSSMAESNATTNLLDSVVRVDFDGRNYSKNEYAYDANGNRILNTPYRWDSATSQWVESYKSELEYTYNSDGGVSTARRYSYYIDGSRVHSYTEYYHYSAYELSDINTPQSANTVQVYPNPVVNTLYVNVENGVAVQASIYNLKGQLLLQTNEIEIHFSAYPAGVYIIKVNTGAETITQKIVKL